MKITKAATLSSLSSERRRSSAAGEGVLSSVEAVAAKKGCNLEQAVVLGDTLRAAWSARLNLTDVEGDDKVGDGHILGLTGAVGHHDGPVVLNGQLSTV